MDERMEVTTLLHRWAGGDRRALDRVMGLVYDELRRVAHRRLRLERQDHTLGTTALVNEAYLRLADIREAGFEDRKHFLAMASRAMRRVLIDHARSRNAQKRGGSADPVPLEEVPQPAGEDPDHFLALNDALERLEARDERQARIVEQYYFGGLTIREVAEVMELSRSTIKRDLRSARRWLAAELGSAGGGGP